MGKAWMASKWYDIFAGVGSIASSSVQLQEVIPMKEKDRLF